mgnify:CR=1 FL=1
MALQHRAAGLSPVSSGLGLLLVVLHQSTAFQPVAPISRFSPVRALRAASLPLELRARTPVCASFEEEQKEAERAETFEYFKTLGGFSFGSLGLFFALTNGAGLEDVAAGNLVLVALCAYGAYLLFFDGGVTQAALENQAVAQLADEESGIMETAPRADVGVYTANAVAAEPEHLVQTLTDDGYARVNGALSPSTAKTLLEYVNTELAVKREAAKTDMAAESAFGDVLMKENRYDLYLDLEPPVREALSELLEPLRPALSAKLGEDAELFELSALISDPRSPRQPVHPDTGWREGQDVAAITACETSGTRTRSAHELSHPRPGTSRL